MRFFVMARSVRAAAAFVLIAVMTLSWAVLAPDRARVGSTRGSRRPSLVLERRLTVADTSSDDLIARAGARDPFDSPGDTASPPPVTGPQQNRDESTLRLLGTVVDSLGESFVLCQLGDGRAVVLRVGQNIGGYELERVEPSSAVFSRPDGGRVERRVQRGGS